MGFINKLSCADWKLHKSEDKHFIGPAIHSHITFFKSIECHTFSESQAQADLSDNDDNNDNDNNDDNGNNNNSNNNNENKVFFSKVWSVILFRNHKLKPIWMMTTTTKMTMITTSAFS